MGPTSLVGQKIIKPFAANTPFMKKPGTRFTLVKCVKNNCGIVTF